MCRLSLNVCLPIKQCYRSFPLIIRNGGSESVSYDRLDQFPYVTAVISEAMRMWPPVTPFIALQRAANKATQIGNHHIPQGAHLWLNVLAIHRNERHYPQPEVRTGFAMAVRSQCYGATVLLCCHYTVLPHTVFTAIIIACIERQVTASPPYRIAGRSCP